MKHYTLIFFIVYATSQALAAQHSTLSLSDCIKRAEDNSFLIEASMKETKAAQKKVQYARSESLPWIGGALSANRYQLKPYSFEQKWVQLTSDWSLGDFLLNTAQLAKQDELIAEVNIQQQRLDTGLRCAMLYIRILQKNERKELQQQRLDLLSDHYRVAKAFWQSGNRTQFDLLQTEAEINRLKEEMTYLELETLNCLQELGQLIHETKTDDIELQALDSELVLNRPLTEISQADMRQIPLIASLDLKIKAQQLYTRSLKALQWPHLNVSGGFMQDGDPTADGNYWQVGAGISLPLFRWNAIGYQKQESMALRQGLNFRKQEAERNLSIFTNQVRQKLIKLKDVIKLQKERLEIAENAFKIADANYQAGLMTNLEYLSAQQQLTETYITIQETQLDYSGALVRFYLVTNQPGKIAELEKKGQ